MRTMALFSTRNALIRRLSCPRQRPLVPCLARCRAATPRQMDSVTLKLQLANT
jgi:hypothetical protein